MPQFFKSSAFADYVHNYTFVADEGTIDCMIFLRECQNDLQNLINGMVNEAGAVILWSALTVSMVKADGSEVSPYFSHRKRYIFQSTDVESLLEEVFRRNS